MSPGSRVWKVGFSGEPDPRAVFWALDASRADRTGGSEMWDLDLGSVTGARRNRVEARRLVGARLDRRLREVFHKHLLTDGKARRVVVLENTFLPTFVKEEIARALFDNLKVCTVTFVRTDCMLILVQVPSVSFTPSSLLALAACGRVTGLIVDCGWLETTVTPVSDLLPQNSLGQADSIPGVLLSPIEPPGKIFASRRPYAA